MRKLASIRRIKNIKPIDGADLIVSCEIDGWNVVTQKSNNFKVDDLVVYFEIDSLLPEIENFEFLRDRCYVNENNSVNGSGFQLRTIRLKGIYSQGLILPVDDFKKELSHIAVEEGYDLTEILNVKKYEKPLPASLAGEAKGSFPSFIRKTDQNRIQNVYDDYKSYLHDDVWEETIKLDGTSFTVYINNGEFGVCSRNLDLLEAEGNSYWNFVRKSDLENKLRNLGRNIAIQGELMGSGIQGNQEKMSGQELFVFDVFDIDSFSYLSHTERLKIVDDLELNHVPIIGYPTLSGLSLNDLLERADGPSLNKNVKREGIVFKNIRDPNISFKVISNKWLLKNE